MDEDRVTVNENVGMTELCASAFGDLEQDIMVSVVYQERGAIGKLIQTYCYRNSVTSFL